MVVSGRLKNGVVAGWSVADSGKVEDFRQWLEEPRNMQTFALSIVFAIIFPVYFAWAPSLLGDSIISSSSSGPAGEWTIKFEQENITVDDVVTLGDGEDHVSLFLIEDHPESKTLARITADIVCNDNDDPGPGFNDNGEAEGNGNNVTGEFEEQSASGDCDGNPFSISWDVVEGFDGNQITKTDTKSEIEAEFSDGGLGRGEWSLTLTAEINNWPGPTGNIVDNDEEFTITWTATWFELEMTPSTS
jgi:hypothetical protein